MKKIKTIALVEWNWMGHHPMYFKVFIRALLELGCTVLALCPRPEEVDSSLQDLSASVRSRLTLRRLDWAPAPRGCPRRLKLLVQTLRSFYQVRKRVQQWEAEQGTQVELIFFACIYDYQFKLFPKVEWLLPYRWSGLHLHCRQAAKLGSNISPGELLCPDYFLHTAKLHSVAILDESATTALARAIDRPVMAFPDLTDEAAGMDPTPLAKKIKRFAAGAPIIVVLGYLISPKGVTTLARLALDPANSDLCFAFVGEVGWESFKAEDRALMSSLANGCANAYTHFARVPDEPSLNGIVQASSVVFAAYHGFPSSSNVLTKAAVFQKPIIVSDGFLMAERVRKYQIGEVVPEGDVEATGHAIRKIIKDPDGWRARNNPKWQDYHDNHSYRRLKESFSNLLAAG